MKFALLVAASVSLSQAAAPFDRSLPCMTQPINTILAGQSIQFELFNGYNTTCEAFVSFDNPDFVPLTFLAVPRNCSGNQLVSLQIPQSVSNGLASIQWKCQGGAASSCELINVEGGCNDLVSYESDIEQASLGVQCVNRATGLGKRFSSRRFK